MSRVSVRAPYLALLFVLVYAAAFGGYAKLRRNTNWDIVPYTALALDPAHESSSALQAATYAELADELGPEKADAFRTGDEYRRACSTDAQVFEEQLGFYRYRKLFPWCLRTLHRAGLGWVTAATWTSILGGVGLVLLTFWWIVRIGAGWRGIAIGALWIPASGAVDIARLWTPDTVGALVALGGLYAWLARSQPGIGAVLLVLSILARSSNVVFVAFLLLALALSAPNKRELVAGSLGLLAAAGLYLWLGREGNGWWPMFVHTCIERVLLPQSAPPSFSVGAYARAVGAGLPYVHLSKAGLWSALMLLNVLLPGVSRRSRFLCVALIASTIVQFLAAPVLWDRLFVAQILLSLFLWLEQLDLRRPETN